MRYLAIMLIAACGVDSPSGPDLGAGPSNATVAGEWTMSFGDMTDGSVTCFTDDFPVTLTQDGVAFSGTFGPATLTCTNGITTGSHPIPGGLIVNGSIATSIMNFDLDTQGLHQSGTWTGAGMRGTARWAFSGTTLNGGWSASRVP
jgi:hypothetical protein